MLTRPRTGLVLKWPRMGPLLGEGSGSVGSPTQGLNGLRNGLAYLVLAHMVAPLGHGDAPRKPPQE
eukprot:6699641-Pyramimonas_sp.AAC.1